VSGNFGDAASSKFSYFRGNIVGDSGVSGKFRDDAREGVRLGLGESSTCSQIGSTTEDS
jgi:hypothetical protein